MKNLNLGWELDSFVFFAKIPCLVFTTKIYSKNVSYYKFSVMKPTVTRNFLSTAPTFLIDHGHTMEKHNKTQLIRHIF